MNDLEMGFQRVALWPESELAAIGCEACDAPYMTVHIPESQASNMASVIICPGGGYAFLSTDHEGIQCAEWLNSFGVAAFVLHYRVAPKYHHPAPLMDIQRALRLVRYLAEEWNLDAHKVGIWGFSAGGHLASTAATHFDAGNNSSRDPIEREDCRPDFVILGYPVITFSEPYVHMGSRINLIGENADGALIKQLSNETQVTSETPETFIFHTDADDGVPSENSVLYYLALRKAGVPAEIHIFANGPHGIGLAQDDAVLSKWPELLKGWLCSRGIA